MPDDLLFFFSLVHEREAQLFDGSRILRHDRYDALQKILKCSDEAMAEKKLLKIHKNFRIVALAEPPNSTGIMLNLLVYYIILKMKAEI